MNKDEILNKSKNENKEFDERELLIQKEASDLSIKVGTTVGTTVFIVLMVLNKELPNELCALYFSIIGTRYTYLGFKLDNNKKMALGLFYLIFSLIAIIMFIKGLIK